MLLIHSVLMKPWQLSHWYWLYFSTEQSNHSRYWYKCIYSHIKLNIQYFLHKCTTVYKASTATVCSAVRMRFLSVWKSSSFSWSERREAWNFSDRREAIDCLLGCNSCGDGTENTASQNAWVKWLIHWLNDLWNVWDANALTQPCSRQGWDNGRKRSYSALRWPSLEFMISLL